MSSSPPVPRRKNAPSKKITHDARKQPYPPRQAREELLRTPVRQSQQRKEPSEEEVLRPVLESINAEIAELQREIALLEREERARTKKPSDTEELISRLLAANDSHITIPKPPKFSITAEADIPSALPLPTDKPLPQLKMFSSITFTSCNTTLEPSDSGILRHQSIHGYVGKFGVGMLDFHLDLRILEDQVVDLSAKIPVWARKDLTAWVRECEESLNPSYLLYALNSYHPLAVKRAATFAAVSKRYMEFTKKLKKAAWMGVDTMTFRREKEGPEVVVRWQLEVDDVGDVKSKLTAGVRVPGVYAEDEEWVRIAGWFREMVEEVGVSKAIEATLQSVLGAS
ncbi:hypothetical protein BZA77DRAFT_388574 [Pyronema omphalodes]|nr:hypothetical protein BZA77DRAFT_388574 [Pyronema omphalodes]